MGVFEQTIVCLFFSYGIQVDAESLVNIALNKHTVQDGELHYPNSDQAAYWSASHAVDGKKVCPTNADYIHYSATAVKDEPWWQVDLGKVYSISKINVYGRPSQVPPQLHGFIVHLSIVNHTTSTNHVYNNSGIAYGNGSFIDILGGKIYTARYLTIVLPKPGSGRYYDSPLVLCEVEIYGKRLPKTVNIAHIADVRGSSVLAYNGHNYSEINVIDGNPASDPDNCDCCWHSDNEQLPWLESELPYSAPVITITVIGRTDSGKRDASKNLSGLKIQVDNRVIPDDWVLYNTADNVVTIYPQTTAASSIKFTRPGTEGQWFLIICEVYINTTGCNNGYYGNNCNSTCSRNCKPGSPKCNTLTGVCTNGCIAGFNGSHCSQPCVSGRYGENCANHCHHCLSGTNCNTVTGNCLSGCNPGFKGDICNTSCGNGHYGYNCNLPCNKNCKQGSQTCNTVTGVCTNGCKTGYNGTHCTQRCDNGHYGYNCSSTCSNNCKPGSQTCNTVTGVCKNGCKAGYIGSQCTKSCASGRYGKNCAIKCGNCLSVSSCNGVTGNCPAGCDIGFKGDKCVTKCDSGRFGENCSHICHCRNNATCDTKSGVCPDGCDFEWKGTACDKDKNILRTIIERAKTSMSTTAHNWTSDLAIDGDVGPDPDACHCCSGTQNSQTSWWMVDLGKRYPVNQITVYSRNNEQFYQQLTDFQLVLANGTDPHSFMLVRNITKRIVDSKHEVTFPSTLSRYVRIQRPGVLTLCEVLVYEGECQIGTFGEECTHRCHCADERPCDVITGHCQVPACKTGWIGLACNKQCPQDTFGDKCSEKCFCAEGTCTNNYGICHGKCRHGYTGSHCNEVAIIDKQNETDVYTKSEYKTTTVVGTDVHAGSEHKTATVVGGAVGGSVAVLVVIVAISVIVFRLRKRNSNDSKNDYATPDITHAQIETEYDTLDNMNDNQGQSNSNYENERVSAF